MTREEQKYRVTTRHQLVDLNKDCTNFKLRFECYSDPKDSFQMCVTNQDELDTKDLSVLPFKEVVGGSISGNIVADTNTYQNYFIVLRSEKECDVVVVIDLEPIEFLPPSLSSEETEDANGHHQHSHGSLDGVHASDYPLWKRMLFYFGIMILLGVIAYYILTFGKTEVNIEHDGIPSLIDDITNHL
jgi:hypothetical protein